MQFKSFPDHRGTPGGFQAFGHRACALPVLVFALPKKVEDALPDSQTGHRTICLAGMMHYLQGTTLSQILDVYNYHLHSR
ncbi:MAG: hypothetical protein DWH82_03385 [Planctomycetota bacterium]|nr:MAG: hypothetical protein DWH82_03385 [Planctomycetota bacterium]